MAEFDTGEQDELNEKLEERKEKIRKENEMKYDEEFHTQGRPEWTVDLYLKLDKFILALKPGVRKEYFEAYIKYSYQNVLFTYIALRKSEILKIWVKVPYSSLGSTPLFVRDYEQTSRRIGVMITLDDQREFVNNEEAILKTIYNIIKKALENLNDKKAKFRSKSKVVSIPEFVKLEKFNINIQAGTDGFVELKIRLHKSQLTGILEKIL